MSRRKKRYRAPSDDDLSLLVYLNANGDLMHIMFDSGPVAGVFNWEAHYEFFVEFGGDDEEEDY
jgi:hypothetical protein